MRGKKNTLYLLLFISCVSVCFYFDARLITALFFPVGWPQKISIVLFILCINLFWFYGLYHIFFIVFSRFFFSPKSILSKSTSILRQLVAILYTTKNDFQEEAAYSCLRQAYNRFDVYILDDSDDEIMKGRIDQFVSKYPQVCLIRREHKNGFKAGNLNHTLRQIYQKYGYFAVCDADTILPENFLSGLLPYFAIQEGIGFVQANQRANQTQKSVFATILSLNTDLHWKYYVPARERYGFTMFYGHGAAISMEAWEAVGGFPEIATEDLAFSSLLREKGYKGVFVPHVVCLEDYPQTYERLLKRNRKWIMGTVEYLFKYFPSLVSSKNVSWVEKTDIFVSAFSLLLAFPFLIYVLDAGIALPFSQNLFNLNIPVYLILPKTSDSLVDFLTKLKYEVSWFFDFFIVMFISSIAQVLPVFFLALRKPMKAIRYIGMFSFLSISTVIASSLDLLDYFLYRKAFFPVTGAGLEKVSLGRRIILIGEIASGIILLYIAYLTSNLWLVTIGLAFLLNSFVSLFNFNNLILNMVLYLPFLLNIIILILIARTLK